MPIDGALAHEVTVKRRALEGDVVGIGAAAAAHNRHARLDERFDGFHVGFGRNRVDRAAVHHGRQTGVGLQHDRAGGPGEHRAHQGRERCRPQRAVDAHHVDSQGRKRKGGHFGARAQKGAPVLFEGHRREYRKVGLLFAGEDGGLHLEQIGHRLDDEEVGPVGGRRASLFGEELVGVVEGVGAHGLEQSAAGADVGGHVAGSRPLGAPNGRFEDGIDRRGPVELEGVRPEGVGRHDFAACGDVGAMHGLDLLGLRDAQELGQLAGFEPGALEHRAHSAVEEQVVPPLEHAAQMVVLGAHVERVARAQPAFGYR